MINFNKSFFLKIIVGIIILLLVSLFLLRNVNIINRSVAEVFKRDSLRTSEVIIGNESAPVSIIMYYNYNCTHCRDFFISYLPKIQTNYVDKDFVNLILRPVCLNNNPNVQYSLETALCLNRLGLFDIIHEILLTDYQIIYTKDFRMFVDELMHGNAELEQCLMTNESKYIIENNNYDMSLFKSNGTPLFIVGKTVIKGKPDYVEFDKLLKKEIERAI